LICADGWNKEIVQFLVDKLWFIGFRITRYCI
jgi:hypothetical protein